MRQLKIEKESNENVLGLGTILKDSALILRHNLSLLHPFVMLVLVMLLLSPEQTVPVFSTRLLIFFGLLIMVAFAFMAGALNMVFEACRTYFSKIKPGLHAPTQKPNTVITAEGDRFERHQNSTPSLKEGDENLPSEELLDPFFVFKAFFPGVSAYFYPFTIGSLISLVAGMGILYAAQYTIQQSGGVPEEVMALMKLGNQLTPEKILALSEPARMQMGTIIWIFIAGVLVYSVFNMLFGLWPIFMVVENQFPIKAYKLSIKQFFSDPFVLFSLFALNGLALLVLRLVLGINMVTAVFMPLVMMALHVYFWICLFVYTYHRSSVANDFYIKADDDVTNSVLD